MARPAVVLAAVLSLVLMAGAMRQPEQELIIPGMAAVHAPLVDMGEADSVLNLATTCEKCAFATKQIKELGHGLEVRLLIDDHDEVHLELTPRADDTPLSKTVCAGNVDCVAFVEKAKSSPRFISSLFYGCTFTVWGDENQTLMSQVIDETVPAGQALIQDTTRALADARKALANATAAVAAAKSACLDKHSAAAGHKIDAATAGGEGPCSEESEDLSDLVGKREQAQADIAEYFKYKKEETANQYNTDFDGSKKYYMTTLRYDGKFSCPTPVVCAAMGPHCDAYSGAVPPMAADSDRSGCLDAGSCFGGRSSSVPESFLNKFARIEPGRVKVETALPQPDKVKAIIPHATVGQVLELSQQREADRRATADLAERTDSAKESADIKAVAMPEDAPHHRHGHGHGHGHGHSRHAKAAPQHLKVVQFLHGKEVGAPDAADADAAAGPRVMRFLHGKLIEAPAPAKHAGHAAKPHATHHHAAAAAKSAPEGPVVLRFNHGHLVDGAGAELDEPAAAARAADPAPVVMQFRDGEQITGPGAVRPHKAAPDHQVVERFEDGEQVSGPGAVRHPHRREDPDRISASRGTPKAVLSIGSMQCANRGGSCEPGSWCCANEEYWYGQGVHCTPVGVCIQACLNPTDTRDASGHCLYGGITPAAEATADSITQGAAAVGAAAVAAVTKVAQTLAVVAGPAPDLAEAKTAAPARLGVGQRGCNGAGAALCEEGAWCCYQEGYYFGASKVPCVSAGVCIERCVHQDDTRDNGGRCWHGGLATQAEKAAQAGKAAAVAAVAAVARPDPQMQAADQDDDGSDEGTVIAVSPDDAVPAPAAQAAAAAPAAAVAAPGPGAKVSMTAAAVESSSPALSETKPSLRASAPKPPAAAPVAPAASSDLGALGVKQQAVEAEDQDDAADLSNLGVDMHETVAAPSPAAASRKPVVPVATRDDDASDLVGLYKFRQ